MGFFSRRDWQRPHLGPAGAKTGGRGKEDKPPRTMRSEGMGGWSWPLGILWCLKSLKYLDTVVSKTAHNSPRVVESSSCNNILTTKVIEMDILCNVQRL
jgi:hypothetical protein